MKQFTWKFKVDSVYHLIQKQPDGMFVNCSMNWCSYVHICAFFTLHFALNWFCVYCFVWVASYDGPVSFWQPLTLCRWSQFSQLYCCIVENKPFLSMQLTETWSLSRRVQLWLPQPLCWQCAIFVSVPLQWTLSNQIHPVPEPWRLPINRPLTLCAELFYEQSNSN